MKRRNILSGLMALAFVLGGMAGAVAQALPSADLMAQAAAMTLTTEDLPTGFDLVGETFLDGSAIDGVTAHYVSTFVNTDSGLRIRSYVYLFDNADAAKSALGAIRSADGLEMSTAEIGESDGQIGVGSFTNTAGEQIATTDASFLRGNVVAGVAVDDSHGAKTDTQLVTDLAKLQDARVQAVSGGTSPVDLALPGQIVPLGTGGALIQAGYLTAGESEAMYGTSGTVLSNLESSWVQTTAFGENGSAPNVTIAITTFGSVDDAKAVVEQSDRIFPALADQERIDDMTIDGVDDVVAYRYTSRGGQIGDLDSLRIIFSKGAAVTVVDVQGASDSAIAEAAASTIARSQLACQTGGACEIPVAPEVIPAN